MKTSLPTGIYCEYRNGVETWYGVEGGYCYPVIFDRIVNELATTRYVPLVVCDYIKYFFCRFEVVK